MSDEIIIRHCSPTLAGLKTGSIFNVRYLDKRELLESVRSLNRRLVPKGVRLIPLRICPDKAFLYLYRPQKLENDLVKEQAANLLEQYGYLVDQPGKCVLRLSQRFCQEGEFPHEMGLFLGYPPEDVKGFIENRAEGYKCVGYWKVYGDEQSARNMFARYKKCTDLYCTQWSQGKSIEWLTVAVG